MIPPFNRLHSIYEVNNQTLRSWCQKNLLSETNQMSNFVTSVPPLCLGGKKEKYCRRQ